MTNEPLDAMSPPIPIPDSFESIPICETNGELESERSAARGEVAVYLDALPRPDFTFKFKPTDKIGTKLIWDRRLNPSSAGLTLEVDELFGSKVVENVGFRDGTYFGQFASFDVRDDEVVDSLSWLIINGPETYGLPIKNGGARWLGRCQFILNDWAVTLDSRKVKYNTFPYDITHVLRCQRPDAAPFSFADARDIEEVLFRTLSLAKGAWVGMAGPWGEVSGNAIWVRPFVHKVRRKSTSVNWFPTNGRDNVFQDAAQAMWKCWQGTRRDTMITASHWYTEASLTAGGVEGAIILIQAALETIAWHVFVVERGFPKRDFDKFNAADKIRQLMSLYGIAFDLPEDSESIKAFAADRSLTNESFISDLVGVLVDVRNCLIHGTPSKVKNVLLRRDGQEERIDIWWYGLRLLEKTLLAFLDYRGRLAYPEEPDSRRAPRIGTWVRPS